MQQLVRLLGLERKSPAEANSTNSVPPDDAETVIELMIAQHFATAEWNKSIFQ
jgi:hypothetical protein